MRGIFCLFHLQPLGSVIFLGSHFCDFDVLCLTPPPHLPGAWIPVLKRLLGDRSLKSPKTDFLDDEMKPTGLPSSTYIHVSTFVLTVRAASEFKGQSLTQTWLFWHLGLSCLVEYLPLSQSTNYLCSILQGRGILQTSSCIPPLLCVDTEQSCLTSNLSIGTLKSAPPWHSPPFQSPCPSCLVNFSLNQDVSSRRENRRCDTSKWHLLSQSDFILTRILHSEERAFHIIGI